MSVRITLVSCTKCDFQSSTISIFGIFKYLLPNNEEIYADRTTGWCDSCKNIRPIEHLPDETRICDRVDSMNRELKRLTSSFIGRLFPATKRNIAYLKSELRELEKTLYFVSIRKSPPRCLICGNKDVFQIDFSSKDGKIEHPGCAGELITNTSGARYAFRSLDRLYDVEGNKIQETEQMR
jgi:hypothetical protein